MSINFNSASSPNPSNLAANSTTTTNSLGNSTNFMELLVDELENQDPESAMSTSDMLNQLSEIESLQQMNQLTQTDQTTQNTVNDLFAHQFLGSKVTVQDANGNAVTGTVTSVNYQGGSPNLIINQQAYPLTSLVSETTNTD